MCFTIGKPRIRISARNMATSIEDIHGFPQSLQATLLKKKSMNVSFRIIGN